MPVSDPLLFAASLLIAGAAIAGLRPVVVARRQARAAARAARRRAQRTHATIEALREARRRG